MVTRGQLRALLFVSGLHIVSADFVYVDFNSTLGLEFNGHSTTTSCEEASESVYIAGKYYEYEENVSSIPSQGYNKRSNGYPVHSMIIRLTMAEPI